MTTPAVSIVPSRPPRTPLPAARERKRFSVRETFGLDVAKSYEIEGYAAPDRETPAVDPGYVFPREDTLAFLLGVQMGDRILVHGHTGTGKTSLVEQVAARLGYNVVKINFDGGIGRDDLIGTHVVRGGEVVFQHGVLPRAYRDFEGCFICLDEWDSIADECAFVLQRPLQKDDGKLLILENGGEVLPLPAGHHIVATANTCGQGDESGLYSTGTRVQNYAQLNRFGTTIKLGYLGAADEAAMLLKRFAPAGFKKVEAELFVRVIGKVRDGFAAGTLSSPLSSRDLINWVEKFIKIGDAGKAAKYAFLNRMAAEDAESIRGLIQRGA